MNTENLLLAVRPIYILIPRPGDSTTSQPKFWAMLLDGLNPIHIKNAAKALRDSRKSPDRPVSKDSGLISLELEDNSVINILLAEATCRLIRKHQDDLFGLKIDVQKTLAIIDEWFWGEGSRESFVGGYRLIAFDLRGHGQSTKTMNPAEYVSGNNWADDISAVIRKLGLSNVTVVAHSYS